MGGFIKDNPHCFPLQKLLFWNYPFDRVHDLPVVIEYLPSLCVPFSFSLLHGSQTRWNLFCDLNNRWHFKQGRLVYSIFFLSSMRKDFNLLLRCLCLVSAAGRRHSREQKRWLEDIGTNLTLHPLVSHCLSFARLMSKSFQMVDPALPPAWLYLFSKYSINPWPRSLGESIAVLTYLLLRTRQHFY